MRHEGELLRELLRKHKTKQIRLREAAKVDGTTVWRWMNSAELSDVQWAKIAPALQKLGIEPTAIKPLPSTGEEHQEDPLVVIWPLVDGMTKRQTEVTLQILSLRPELISTVKAILRDRLARNH